MDYIIGIKNIADCLNIPTQHLTCLRKNNKELRMLIEKYFTEDNYRPNYRVAAVNIERVRDIVSFNDSYYIGTVKSINRIIGITKDVNLFDILNNLNISFEVKEDCCSKRTVLRLLNMDLERCKDYVRYTYE